MPDLQAFIQIVKISRRQGGTWPYLLKEGLPLVLPNLWIEETCLGRGANTAEAYLRDVSLIYAWATKKGVSVEKRLSSLQGFTGPETQAIAREICTTRSGKNASKATCLRRFESVRSFINFGFEYYTEVNRSTLSEQAQGEKNLKKQLTKLYRLVRRYMNEAKPGTKSTDLEPLEFQIIEDIIHPDSPKNPFSSKNVKIRNYCIIHVGIETLARRGELVLIEIDDLDLSAQPTITIKKPSDNNKFKRSDGASLKTRGRTVPISKSLANVLRDYLTEVRPEFLRPRRPSKSLFLSDRDGRRLSAYTVNLILNVIAKQQDVVLLQKRLHPHGLRSTGSNEMRRVLTAAEASAMELAEALEYAGGWSPGSPHPNEYSRTAMSERLGSLLRKGSRKYEGDGGNDD